MLLKYDCNKVTITHQNSYVGKIRFYMLNGSKTDFILFYMLDAKLASARIVINLPLLNRAKIWHYVRNSNKR
jgi:hypothetical protein